MATYYVSTTTGNNSNAGVAGGLAPEGGHLE